MTKRKISMLLLVAICLTLLVGVFVGCNNIQIDEAILNALNEYFQGSEVEVQHSFGKYNGATVLLVKTKAIEYLRRKDTINGIEFKYAQETQLFVVKDGKVSTLKEAYLNLMLDSAVLQTIKTSYDKKFEEEQDVNYFEIGNAIVLEEKILWDESKLEYYDIEDGEHKVYEIYDYKIFVVIDNNFTNYHFSANDFPMLDIQSCEVLTEGYFEAPNKFPDTFHHIISIKINNVGRKNVINGIELLQKLDFVLSAEPSIKGHWELL